LLAARGVIFVKVQKIRSAAAHICKKPPKDETDRIILYLAGFFQRRRFYQPASSREEKSRKVAPLLKCAENPLLHSRDLYNFNYPLLLF